MTHLRRTIGLYRDRDALDFAAQVCPEGEERIYRFEPHGLSVTRIGAHVTVAVHTWPEHRAATVDVYQHGRDEGGL